MDYIEAKQRIFEIVIKRILKDTTIDLNMLRNQPDNFETFMKDDIFFVALAARKITTELMDWSCVDERRRNND